MKKCSIKKSGLLKVESKADYPSFQSNYFGGSIMMHGAVREICMSICLFHIGIISCVHMYLIFNNAIPL